MTVPGGALVRGEVLECGSYWAGCHCASLSWDAMDGRAFSTYFTRTADGKYNLCAGKLAPLCYAEGSPGVASDAVVERQVEPLVLVEGHPATGKRLMPSVALPNSELVMGVPSYSLRAGRLMKIGANFDYPKLMPCFPVEQAFQRLFVTSGGVLNTRQIVAIALDQSAHVYDQEGQFVRKISHAGGLLPGDREGEVWRLTPRIDRDSQGFVEVEVLSLATMLPLPRDAPGWFHASATEQAMHGGMYTHCRSAFPNAILYSTDRGVFLLDVRGSQAFPVWTPAAPTELPPHHLTSTDTGAVFMVARGPDTASGGGGRCMLVLPPWSPPLHQAMAPRGFADAVRAVLLLGVSGSSGGGGGVDGGSGGGEQSWGLLPFEVWDMIIRALWRSYLLFGWVPVEDHPTKRYFCHQNVEMYYERIH